MNELDQLLAIDRLLMRARLRHGRALPISVGVVADLKGKPTEPRSFLDERRFLHASTERLDNLVSALEPRAAFAVPNRLGGDGLLAIDLRFRRMADFEPAGIVAQVEPLRVLRAHLLDDSKPELAAEVIERIGAQLDEIVHHAEFQALESSWRGLQFLLRQTRPYEAIRVRVLDLPKAELAKSMKRFKGVAHDQSPLFKKLYDEEYRSFGGEPFCMLVADYEFSDAPPDVDALCEVAKLVGPSHAMFVAGVSPLLFRLQGFAEVAQLRSIETLLRSGAYRAWNSVREEEAGTRLVLALPRMLARLPYRHASTGGKSSDSVRTEASKRVPYDESVRHPGALLYTSGAFVLSARLAAALARAELSGSVETLRRGGLVDGIEHLPIATCDAAGRVPPSLDASFRGSVAQELRESGINVISPLGAGDRLSVQSETALAPAVPVLWQLLIGRVAHRLQQLRFQQRGAPALAAAPRDALDAVGATFAWPPSHDEWLPVPGLANVAVTWIPAQATVSQRMQVGIRMRARGRRDEDERFEITVQESSGETTDHAAAPDASPVVGRWIVEDGGVG